MIYIFISLLCLANLNYCPDFDDYDSSIQAAARNRYQDTWFFKDYRMKKYMNAAQKLSESSKKLLQAHTTPGRTVTSDSPQDLNKLDQEITNLSNQKKSLFSKNFSGTLLRDLQATRDQVAKNISQRQREIARQHEVEHDKINEIPSKPINDRTLQLKNEKEQLERTIEKRKRTNVYSPTNKYDQKMKRRIQKIIQELDGF